MTIMIIMNTSMCIERMPFLSNVSICMKHKYVYLKYYIYISISYLLFISYVKENKRKLAFNCALDMLLVPWVHAKCLSLSKAKIVVEKKWFFICRQLKWCTYDDDNVNDYVYITHIDCLGHPWHTGSSSQPSQAFLILLFQLLSLLLVRYSSSCWLWRVTCMTCIRVWARKFCDRTSFMCINCLFFICCWLFIFSLLQFYYMFHHHRCHLYIIFIIFMKITQTECEFRKYAPCTFFIYLLLLYILYICTPYIHTTYIMLYCDYYYYYHALELWCARTVCADEPQQLPVVLRAHTYEQVKDGLFDHQDTTNSSRHVCIISIIIYLIIQTRYIYR